MSALEEMRVCECGHRPAWHVDVGDGHYHGEPFTHCRHIGRTPEEFPREVPCSCMEYRESNVPNTRARCTCGHTYGQHLTQLDVDLDGALMNAPGPCEPYTWETPRDCPCVQFQQATE